MLHQLKGIMCYKGRRVHSTPTLSNHTAITDTTLPKAGIGSLTVISNRAKMNKTSSVAPAAQMPSGFPTREQAQAGMNSVDVDAVSSNKDGMLIRNSHATFIGVAKPTYRPLSLCRRFKAKCQKFLVSINNYGPTASQDNDLGYVDLDENNDDEFERDTDDADNEIGSGPSHPRFDWDTIKAIPNDRIVAVVDEHLCGPDDLQVTCRISGTWNFVAFLSETKPPESSPGYVVRIPAKGTPAHWTPEDAYMLEREVQLIEYIRQNTKAPVPHIIAYSSHCNNTLRAPYVLMTKLPGKNAHNVWFDTPYNPTKAFKDADVPSTTTEKKRVNFLRSLARAMTEIQALSFDKIGMLHVSEDGQVISVGPSYGWYDEVYIDKATELPAYATTRRYINVALEKGFDVSSASGHDDFHRRQFGHRKILDIIFSQPIFKQCLSGTETFTIHHDDLDLQNILVDDDGNVTGIIDWDNSYSAPRCIGATAVPIFLRNDWYPQYTHNLNVCPHMGWNEPHYRQIYAAAMVEAGNPDAKYTLKSAMYQACVAALHGGGESHDLVDKLVRYIPECRIDPADLRLGLGQIWPTAEKMLECEFKKIFEPELPRAGFLKKLDEELALRGWWCGFDKLLEFYEEEGNSRPRSLYAHDVDYE